MSSLWHNSGSSSLFAPTTRYLAEVQILPAYHSNITNDQRDCHCTKNEVDETLNGTASNFKRPQIFVRPLEPLKHFSPNHTINFCSNNNKCATKNNTLSITAL